MTHSNLTENIFSTAAKKLEFFPEKLHSWREGTPFVPITLELQPSERCNHRCPDCHSKYTIPLREVRRRGRSGVDLDFGLLDSIWDTPPDGVIVSGNTGDPLLYPHIHELLERLGSCGIATVLLTNGEAMTPALARLAVQVCRGIRVSLDGFDSASFRLTHGVGSDNWNRVLGGVRHLVAAKATLGDSGSRCLVGVGYLTDARTRAGMVSATEIARTLGVDYIQFRPFHGTAEVDLVENLAACVALEKPPAFRVQSSHQKYGIAAERGLRRYSRCEGAFFYTLLDARGEFYLCCHHVGNPAARVGSLHETSWMDFVRAAGRRERIEGFDVHGCAPICRLHPHNEALVQIREGKERSAQAMNEEIAWHAPIL